MPSDDSCLHVQTWRLWFAMAKADTIGSLPSYPALGFANPLHHRVPLEIQHAEDDVLRNIDNRVSALTLIRKSHQELVQILRYEQLGLNESLRFCAGLVESVQCSVPIGQPAFEARREICSSWAALDTLMWLPHVNVILYWLGMSFCVSFSMPFLLQGSYGLFWCGAICKEPTDPTNDQARAVQSQPSSIHFYRSKSIGFEVERLWVKLLSDVSAED